MKLLPGRSHSVWVWDPCKYSLSLTLHQRKRFNSYSSRLDRLECSSSIFHASQLWCLFQSHGVFKICLLGTHLQCLLALDPEGLCFQAFLRSILTNECRLILLRSSLGSRMWGFREGEKLFVRAGCRASFPSRENSGVAKRRMKACPCSLHGLTCCVQCVCSDVHSWNRTPWVYTVHGQHLSQLPPWRNEKYWKLGTAISSRKTAY